MLHYCLKDLSIDIRKIQNSRSKSHPCIVPIHKNKFDLITFIQFIDSLSRDFIVSSFSHYRDIISIKVLHINHQNPNGRDFTFFINILQDFERFNVKAWDSQKNLIFQNINGINCICLTPFSNTSVFFSENSTWNETFPYKNSILYILGNYIARKNTNFPLFLKYAFQGFLSNRTHKRHLLPFANPDDIIQIFHHLPGYIYINLLSTYSDGYSINVPEGEKKLKYFIWIMPWVKTTLMRPQYLQLDASFYALKPYCYCIFHSIYYNCSCPFAITIFPSEKFRLYDLFFKGINIFNINIPNLANTPVLSDMNEALKKFCKKYLFKHYYCHRHIIEALGAKSAFGIWGTRILKCRTYISFKQEKEFIIVELQSYEDELRKSLIIDNDTQRRINNIKIMLTELDEISDEDIETYEKSNYFMPKWANWIRREDHVPRCSNHCEGFHGNINKNLPTSGIRSFKTGFLTITNFILNYLNNPKDNIGNSFKKKHSKYIDKIKEILKEHPESFLKCSQKNCDCEEAIYYEKIYGVYLPCIHTVLYTIVNLELFITLYQSQTINAQEFFITFLNKYPKNMYERSKYHENGIQEIRKIYKDNKNQFLLNGNPGNATIDSDCIWIAQLFISRLLYQLPSANEIRPTDKKYIVNQVKYDIDNDDDDDDDDDVIEEKRIKRIKIKEDNNILLDIPDDENYQIIRKKFIETKAEIKAVHKKLCDQAEEICFASFYKNFVKNLSGNQDINKCLADFKISAWKMADTKAGKNKFFQ